MRCLHDHSNQHHHDDDDDDDMGLGDVNDEKRADRGNVNHHCSRHVRVGWIGYFK